MNTKTYKLELFYFDSCPFCQRVITYIEQEQIKDIEFKDIRQDNDSLKRLQTDTGRTTVPCLYIDNKPMFESLDILNWLKNNCTNI